ncbi:MAG: DNA-deoxyinosine glycosylase [Deltaproteobacteria bacterium]|nr:DNA-deoxyinosine glycosylase [Deltaproteobacteria bacterium]
MAAKFIRGLPLIEAPVTRLLILGSMPGQESLLRQQYYAHPRNTFWFIIGELLGIDSTIEYQERLQIIREKHISLWDVIENCIRPGSLDGNIVNSSEKANNIKYFYRRHPELEAIAFNGRKARQSFTTHFLRRDPQLWQKLILLDLPSTSPAHATLRPQEKSGLWQAKLTPFLSRNQHSKQIGN